MKIPTTLKLETDRCRLRFVSKEDIPHIFSATRYSGFNDGMLWEPPINEDELIEPYERNVKAWTEGSAYTFSIERKKPEEFIGRIAIRRQSDEQVWDLGFWTHPERQGQGYMSEAVRTVIEFGFEELQASKITACHALWNTQSEKVLKKNRMTFIEYIPEGFKKHGKWVEENHLGITRDEYDKH